MKVNIGLTVIVILIATTNIHPAPFPLEGKGGGEGRSSLHPLTIPEVLKLAEQVSPDLKASLQRERAAQQNISILKALYLPTLNAEAIDSFGFPGSSGALGVSGLMGSPFRSGPAAGMTGSLTLFDWGRGYSVEASKAELKSVQEQTRITRYGIDQFALQLFLDAGRFRGQNEAYAQIAAEVSRVAREVDKFVRTGQRSVVDRLLIQDQTTEAQMTAAAFQKRYEVALRRVALAVGLPANSLSCPSSEQLSEQSLIFLHAGYGSPLIAQAADLAQAAHTNVSYYSAQNLPKLKATASAGDMDESRLVDKKYYSGGFGVDLPVFEGNRITSQIQQAQALAAQKDQDLDAVKLQVDELNARYDEIIEASRVQMDYLARELDVAKKALSLAKDRYYSFQGTLVDVREALRNLERIQSEIIDVKSDLLLAIGSKALLNGASI